MTIGEICLTVGIIACAFLAIRSRRLVAASLWLAALSVLVALFMYLLGATRVAVIELSVGAGLVTVLLVFAIGIVSEESAPEKPLVPRPVSWGLGLVVAGLLGWLVFPPVIAPPPSAEPSLAGYLWEGRALDVLIQVVLIFCGVLGILRLLTEVATAESTAKAEARPVPSPGADPQPGIEEGRMQL
jgi:uncharacterized MnhB-related membrane protein